MCGGEEGLRASEGSHVEFGVIFDPGSAVFSWRDTGRRADFVQPVAQAVGVMAAVGDDGAALGDIRLKAATRL